MKESSSLLALIESLLQPLSSEFGFTLRYDTLCIVYLFQLFECCRGRSATLGAFVQQAEFLAQGLLSSLRAPYVNQAGIPALFVTIWSM